jgi:long-chain acyl-CoA synthetase
MPVEAHGPDPVRSLLAATVRRHADRPALSLLADGRWTTVTYRELAQRAETLTGWLLAAGLRRGDRIAILSESRPEWGIAFFAAVRSGATVVPLDVKLTVAELETLMRDAEPRVLFISSRFVVSAEKLRPAVAALEHIVVLDTAESRAFPCLDDLTAPPPMSTPERSPDETALIVYTSGTTGQPKGVMIRFGSLLFEVAQLATIMHFEPGDVLLSILPLNHLLELTCGFLGPLRAGGHICYVQTLYPDEIVEALRDRRARTMVVVPLVLKMLAQGLDRERRKAGATRRALFTAAWALAPWVPTPLRRWLFWPVHRALGGRLRSFCSGGARLDSEIADYFARLGILVYQGYGLTETSPVVTLNSPGATRDGSVGRALPGAELRIASAHPGEDGEILTRGPHVMQGYYKRADLTQTVVDAEGWLHTGDVGHLDADGFLYLTGRLKSLIVLSGGKKVYPEEVEAALAESPAIREVCVLPVPSSDRLTAGGEEVGAVIVPADEIARRFRGQPEALAAEIQREVERLAVRLAPYKRPRAVWVWEHELPKTPSHKIRRGLVLEQLGR